MNAEKAVEYLNKQLATRDFAAKLETMLVDEKFGMCNVVIQETTQMCPLLAIFEYKCAHCGTINEVLVQSANALNPSCPNCGSEDTRKLFSTFAPQVRQSPPPSKPGCISCPNNSCPHVGGA